MANNAQGSAQDHRALSMKARAFFLSLDVSMGSVFIMPALLALYSSGLAGIWLWPPPGLQETYSTLINWTGISGPTGGLIRVMVSLFGLIAWLSRWPKLRFVAYFNALMCCFMIALSFFDVGQGFAFGAWLSPFLLGLASMYHLRG